MVLKLKSPTEFTDSAHSSVTAVDACIELNEWNHIVISFSGSTIVSNQIADIGRWVGSDCVNDRCCTYWDGIIDDLRIYNRILSASEIEDYNNSVKVTVADEPTPIKLLSFTAKCNNQNAIISWTTATEINNDYFILEKSYDAQNFFEIARIEGAGFSNMDLSYEFIDTQMFPGDNYYRLTQVDYDLTSETFNIIHARCDYEDDGGPKLLIYPNPFKSEIHIWMENIDDDIIDFKIYDKLGRLIIKDEYIISGSPDIHIINLKDLKSASYFLRAVSKNHKFEEKIVKY